MSREEHVLLINPPVNLDRTLGKFKICAQATPPLGLAYIAAVLLKNKVQVNVLDAYAEDLSLEETLKRIEKINPKFIGITCLTPTASISTHLAKKIKSILPESVIIFGGVHPTLLSNEVLNDESIDIVIRGEGEFTFREVIDVFMKNRSLKDIKGISYKENKKIIHNGYREEIENLDEIPFPAWELFPVKLYRPLPHWTLVSPNIPIFPLLTSRGCPYNCTYCSLNVTIKKFRTRSIKNVVDEIEYINKKFNVKQLMFWDATFPLKKERGIDICKEIIRRGLHKKVKWMCESRVNCIDYETLVWMKRAGCLRIAYGIEAGVQKLLDNIKKRFTLEQVRKAIKATKKAKIEILAYFMLGLPGETKELSQQTIDFAKELNAEYAKFNITVPYPGTELYRQAIKENCLETKEWDKYNSFTALSSDEPVYVPKGMTKKELIKMTKKAYRDYYLRPTMMFKHLKKLSSLNNIKIYLNMASTIIKDFRDK